MAFEQGINLPNLQEKVRLRMELTATEKLFMARNADDKGDPSRRRWLGMKEYPQSVVDNFDY